MSGIETARIAIWMLVAASWAAGGCHHVGPTEEGEADGGSEDSDDEDDPGGYGGYECDGKPGSCAQISAGEGGQQVGCCWNETAYWCESGNLKHQSCGGGEECRYDPVTNWVRCL
jgi:hypothetical protein